MHQRIGFSFGIIFLIIIITNCFPTYTVRQEDKTEIPSDSLIQVASKIQTYNDDIYIFPEGFTLQNESIRGVAKLYSFDKSGMGYSMRVIPLENVATINCYEETTTGGRHFASFLFSITGPPLTALSLYCVSCPKCCFGSCPTVYTKGKDEFELETELFSECIARQLEANDIDLLSQKLDSTGNVEIMVTNEALETHYINKFELVSIQHPIGTKIFPTFNDSLMLVSSFTHPLKAKNSKGRDITNLIQNDDDNYYRTSAEYINELKKGILFDWVDISSNISNDLDEVKVVVKYRNTLLSTILLYDVVLASQGIEAVNWTERMNNDVQYAADFKMVYNIFSGITVNSKENDGWREEGFLKDAGPITWRYAAFKAPVDKDGNVNMRLKFILDNMMIDYITIDTSRFADANLQFNNPLSLSVRDESDKVRNEVVEFIQETDNQYLITNPGDNFSLKYKFIKSTNSEQTLAILSSGYYNEWVRGEWIRTKTDDYTFNIYDIKGTCSYLADSWLLNKDIIEREFFNNRIPLKGVK